MWTRLLQYVIVLENMITASVYPTPRYKEARFIQGQLYYLKAVYWGPIALP
jgi:hypothetical protein